MATWGEVPVLTVAKTGILPTPVADNPMPGLLFVQLKTEPATPPLKDTGAVKVPLHKTWLETTFTVGVGFTLMVKFKSVPVQPLAEGVTVMVAVAGVDFLPEKATSAR